jgi:hypothetical protein
MLDTLRPVQDDRKRGSIGPDIHGDQLSGAELSMYRKRAICHPVKSDRQSH